MDSSSAGGHSPSATPKWRLSSFWPTADPTDVRTAKLNSQPKYVASRTLGMWGSSGLLTDLLADDLVDEFVLLIYPVVLGAGKRLFPAGQSHSLALVSSEVSSKGVIIQVYRRAELPRKGEEWVG